MKNQHNDFHQWVIEKGPMMIFEYFNRTDMSLSGLQLNLCHESSVS